MTTAVANPNGLGFLSDEERNFLLLYRGGGPNSVVVEMGIKRDDVEPRLAAIKAKIEAHRVPNSGINPNSGIPGSQNPGIQASAKLASDLGENLPNDGAAPAVITADADEWPHTEGVVRRQVVDDEAAVVSRIKKARNGDRAYGPVLGTGPTPADDDIIPEGFEAEPAKVHRDPSRSPILDYLTERGPSCSTDIAEHLSRSTSNVSTRLRHLEQGGYVRRTGRTLPGGRGGPRIEWELCDPDKPPTSTDDVLTSPKSELSVRERLERLEATTEKPVKSDRLRERYFEVLLAQFERAEGEMFDRIADRIERLVEAGIA